jgi:hypothetical protein
MSLQIPPLPTTASQVNAGGVVVYQLGVGGGYSLTDAANSTIVIIGNLPTSDPHIPGALYANSTILSISRG